MRNRLRVLRAESHLSQAQLAEHLGVARQTVHAIETGKFSPSLTLAFKIATLFATDINDVFAPDAEDTLDPILEPEVAVPEPTSARNERTARPRPLVFFGRRAADNSP